MRTFLAFLVIVALFAGCNGSDQQAGGDKPAPADAGKQADTGEKPAGPAEKPSDAAEKPQEAPKPATGATEQAQDTSEKPQKITPGEAATDSRQICVIRWEDAQGDVIAEGGETPKSQPDITGVKAWSRDGFIYVEFEIKGGIMPLFSHTNEKGMRRGYKIAGLYINIDENPETGSIPPGCEAGSAPGGFEYEFVVQTGFTYKPHSGGDAASRTGDFELDPKIFKITGKIIDYKITALGDVKQEDVELAMKGKSTRDYTRITEKGVEIRIPYKAFGVQGGHVLLMCFREFAAKEDKAFSEQRILTLTR